MAQHAQTTFLSLPLEVRSQIYELSIAPSRLSTRPILDPEWLFAANRGCTSACPLLLTSRQIHLETTPIFYSRATLEVTPCQHDPADARCRAEYLSQYERDHAFCRSHHLRMVRNVHVYADQAWPVDQDAFQALFRWLVSSTGVRWLYLSRKTMQQGRHVPELICLNGLAYDVANDLRLDGDGDEVRVIDVYARNVSSRLRFMEGRNGLLNRTKPWPDVQLYFLLQQGGGVGVDGCGRQTTLYREPRWDLLTDKMPAGENCLGAAAASKEILLRQQMNRFAAGDLGDTFLKQAHVDGYLWLYKTIQIQQRIRFRSVPEEQEIRLEEVHNEPVLVF